MTFNADGQAQPRSPAVVQWRWYTWGQFDPDTLYAYLKLRSDIFVVEQNCAYPDMDGIDPACSHLIGRDRDGKVIAALRLVPPGIKNEEPWLGRVVVERGRRGGTGRLLMLEGIAECARRHPRLGIRLGGQQHLEPFYASLGFVTCSAPYLEDGIPHVEMRRLPES